MNPETLTNAIFGVAVHSGSWGWVGSYSFLVSRKATGMSAARLKRLVEWRHTERREVADKHLKDIHPKLSRDALVLERTGYEWQSGGPAPLAHSVGVLYLSEDKQHGALVAQSIERLVLDLGIDALVCAPQPAGWVTTQLTDSIMMRERRIVLMPLAASFLPPVAEVLRACRTANGDSDD